MNKKIALKELAISGSEFNPTVRDKKWFKFIKTILFGNKELVQDLMENCIDVVYANSLEELAEKMNALQENEDIDVEKFCSAIRDYDAMIDRGQQFFNDDQLRRIAHARAYRGDKVRTSKFQKIEDPKAGPYIAIREHIVTRKTLGGIQTDLSSRVLNDKGEAIEGLYACGEAAGFGGGGIHGQGALEGTFLGGCIFTARIAAHHINGRNLID